MSEIVEQIREDAGGTPRHFALLSEHAIAPVGDPIAYFMEQWLAGDPDHLFPASTPGHGAAHTRIHQSLRTHNQLGALPRHRHGAAFDARRGCEDPRRAGGARVGYLCVGAHGARRLLSLGRGERAGDGGVEIPHAAGRLVTPDGIDRSDWVSRKGVTAARRHPPCSWLACCLGWRGAE